VRELGVGATDARDHEQRIISKAALALRAGRDHAFTATLDDHWLVALGEGIHHRDHAAEACCAQAVLDLGELGQKCSVVLRVGGGLMREAR
jgi:hypothetical protein